MAESIRLGELYADGVRLVRVIALTLSTAVVVDLATRQQEQILRTDWVERYSHVVDPGD